MSDKKFISLANNQHLTPEEREQQRIIHSLGGKAGTRVQKKERNIKEVAKMVLSMPIDINVAAQYCGQYMQGIDEKDLTLDTLMTISMAREVIENGNAKAYEVLRDTSGQSPKTELTLNGNLDVLTSSDRAILAKMREKLPNFGQNDEETEF